MKKMIWLLCLALLLCLLLSACARHEEDDEAAEPELSTTEAAGERPQTEAPQTEAPIQTEPLDAGISSVTIQAPVLLTVTPDTPEAVLNVRFTDVDPTGEPSGGRSCTLAFVRDGEVIDVQDLTLSEGAEVELRTSYEFERYMEQTDSQLKVRLFYGDEVIEAETLVSVQNYPDEIYAQMSGVDFPYQVDVIRNQCVAIVYGLDENGEYTKIVHVYVCTTGYWTPLGWFRMGSRNEWNELFGGVWGQYATVITGDVMFHSVPFASANKDNLVSWRYNQLGTIASMGCIRYTVADAKWLYDNCPIGTRVHIYDCRDADLPVEKPDPPRLDLDDPRANWDPTDPDPENPWRQGEA